MNPAVYLAAPAPRQELMRQWRDDLEAAGYRVTSRWLDLPWDRLPAKIGGAEWRRQARSDTADVLAADVVINCTLHPGEGLGGRHSEYGMGVAWGKRLLLVGGREQVFHAAEEATVYATWAECLAAAPWGVVPDAAGRDVLGRIVRAVWTGWAPGQPDVAEHPSWLVPWERLPERDREVDRLIGKAVAAAVELAVVPAATLPTVPGDPHVTEIEPLHGETQVDLLGEPTPEARAELAAGLAKVEEMERRARLRIEGG